MIDKIKCPKCGHEFQLEDALSGELEAHFKTEFENKMAAQADAFNEEKQKLNADKEALKLEKEKQDELLQTELAKQLKIASQKIEQVANEEVEATMKALLKENEERKIENKSLKQKEVDLLQKEAELKELQEDLSLKMQKEMLEKTGEIEEKARAKERESFELEKVKLLKQIDDNKKLAEEMKRKAEQGSMQLQGEVQELAIEEWLASEFPLDTIEEIKKGARGADCLQFVNTRALQNCGTIYYESKRTKDFQVSWIEKFKADIRVKGADIGVLVTEVMPADMERMGMKEGIWICNYEEFKALSGILRESIIQLSIALGSQENKGDKMVMLYDYLTSSSFRMQIEAIVEGFSQMKTDLESEKRSMARIWKQRDKQIDKVTINTIEMYGSVKGIAGNAIQSVKALELPDGDDELDALEE